MPSRNNTLSYFLEPTKTSFLEGKKEFFFRGKSTLVPRAASKEQSRMRRWKKSHASNCMNKSVLSHPSVNKVIRINRRCHDLKSRRKKSD